MAARTMRALWVCVCWLCLTGSAFGQAYNTADYVKNLYNKYLNREPTSNELTQWVWSFQKGLSLREAQATFLSSDEYFRRYARDSSAFISGLFTDVLGRAPSPRESLQWAHRLNVSGDNRTRIVRDFLKAAEAHISDATEPPPVNPVQEQEGGQQEDEPAEADDGVGQESRLVAMASLLHGAIDEELGGTWQGRRLSIMSRNLIDATRNLEQAKQEARSLYQDASNDVHAALTAVDQRMEQLYYTARASSTYLDQYKTILGTTGEETAVMKPLPMTDRPEVASVDTDLYKSYVQLSRALLSDTKQVIDLIRNSSARNTGNNELLKEIEFFQSRANSVRESPSAGMTEEDLRHEVRRLRAASRGITRLLQRTGQVGLIARRWEIVLDDLKEMGELVGISSGSAIDPGQPVLINLPTYHHMPYQVQRPSLEELSDEARPRIDQAIARIDAFVTGFNRFLHLSPRVPALQSQARRLRMLLAQFREKLAKETATSELKSHVKQIDESLQSVSSLFARTVRERRLTNTPDLTGISQAIERLKEIFDQDHAAAGQP
ncbi:MAG: DUF4214 domain-containing protein [Pirellulaceae bacterium]